MTRTCSSEVVVLGMVRVSWVLVWEGLPDEEEFLVSGQYTGLMHAEAMRCN